MGHGLVSRRVHRRAESSIAVRPIRGARGNRLHLLRRDPRFRRHIRLDFASERAAVPHPTSCRRHARRRAHARPRNPDARGGDRRDQPGRDSAPRRHDGPRVGARRLRILRPRLVADRGAGEDADLLPRLAHGHDRGVVGRRPERHDRVARDPRRRAECARLASESDPVPRRGRDLRERGERGDGSRQPAERVHRNPVRDSVPHLHRVSSAGHGRVPRGRDRPRLVCVPKDLAAPLTPAVSMPAAPLQRRGMVFTLAVTLAVAVAFFASSTPEWLPLIALAGGSFVLFFLPFVSKVTPRNLIAKVDWSIILFFVGLFVLLGGVEASGLSTAIQSGFTSAFGGRSGGLPWLVGLSALLSNLISNVPAVLLLAQVVPQGSTQLWLGLATRSTLAGNATILGAACNVIVVQVASRDGVTVSMRDFVKAGLPVTAATLVLSTFLVALLVPA